MTPEKSLRGGTGMWIRFLAILLIGIGTAHGQTTPGRGYAIVVGVNDYSSLRGWPNLATAESDAREVAKYFDAQGFTVRRLIGLQDATKRKVEEAVDAVAKVIDVPDRFVFFFAGHGKKVPKEGLAVAYLVVPGGRDDEDRNSLISTGDIREYMTRLDRARHQLFIFDSCYSGLMGNLQTRSADAVAEKWSAAAEAAMVSAYRERKVRQYLSAGGENQQVLDGGLSNLSWFTYFLSKQLEQGVMQRPSGLITFSELASSLSASAANRTHTPAFGALPDHQGGDFLLWSKAKGNPRLPPLPDPTPEALYDAGVITRGQLQQQAAHGMNGMKGPIERIYQAWREKDLGLYLRQWAPEVVQTIRWKDGHVETRRYKEIEDGRRRDFGRLDHADVLGFELMYQGFDGKEAAFRVRYSMDFYYKDGKVDRGDRNINECYKVRLDSGDRWVIVRNDDYYPKPVCYQ